MQLHIVQKEHIVKNRHYSCHGHFKARLVWLGAKTAQVHVQATDIQGRSQTSYIVPFYGVVSHGLKLGVFGFLPTTHSKTNASTIFTHRAAFYTCLSSHSDRSRCRWHTHLMNHGYFDYRKTQRPPIWTPCRDKNGAGSGISLVYLWSKLRIWHKCMFMSSSNAQSPKPSFNSIVIFYSWPDKAPFSSWV